VKIAWTPVTPEELWISYPAQLWLLYEVATGTVESVVTNVEAFTEPVGRTVHDFCVCKFPSIEMKVKLALAIVSVARFRGTLNEKSLAPIDWSALWKVVSRLILKNAP
jgi:hypothetical protein